MTTRERESALSVDLASELYRRGFNARAQVVPPDNLNVYVKVLIGARMVALEVKRGQSAAKKALAVKQATALLELELADFVVAVCYPDDAVGASLPQSRLTWTVCYGDKFAGDGATVGKGTEKTGRRDWSEGDMTLLAQTIRTASSGLYYQAHPEESRPDNPDKSSGSSILKIFEEINQAYNELPEEEKLPTDSAKNYKHYLYGFPKEDV